MEIVIAVAVYLLVAVAAGYAAVNWDRGRRLHVLSPGDRVSVGGHTACVVSYTIQQGSREPTRIVIEARQEY